jgi:hypothetical protein
MFENWTNSLVFEWLKTRWLSLPFENLIGKKMVIQIKIPIR